MDLVIDVGNTNIVCGFFNQTRGDYELKHFFRLSTPHLTTTDEFSATFNSLLIFHKLTTVSIDRVIMSSVVPSINHNITKMMNLYFDLDVIELNTKHFSNITIRYDKHTDMGLDRIVNLIATATLYGKPCIVVDYGTAITVDALSAESVFLGGLIIPGVHISLDALVGRTSKLPKIELNYPKKIIGNTTKECMQNGLYYLNSLGIDAIIDQIIEENFHSLGREQIQITATGGLGPFMAKASRNVKNINSQLSLIGLKIILDEVHGRNYKNTSNEMRNLQ